MKYDFVIYADYDLLCINNYSLSEILPSSSLLSWKRSVKIINAFYSKNDLNIVENRLGVPINNND